MGQHKIKRRTFITQTALAGSGLAFIPSIFSKNMMTMPFVSQRPAPDKRHFSSPAVEATIKEIKSHIKNEELAWMFENCFPNTLDTTVDFSLVDGQPDTYVITGDIDAMWMRDSTAQVWPYLPLLTADPKLKDLVEGVINRQKRYILKDPYANAFYKDASKRGEWKDDLTEMLPGVHERKWEIDSLCYPIRLSYHFWKHTGSTRPFDNTWIQAIDTIVKTFRDQQRKDGKSSYTFQRNTPKATDTLGLQGYGYPVKYTGLICSAFRPSDDATVYSYLIPSNYFAVTSLKQASEILLALNNQSLSDACLSLATEVEDALKQHGLAIHQQFGQIIPFEADGYGNYLFMDDANVPGLLSLPYLGCIDAQHPDYVNTRKYVLSEYNPFFFKGKAGEGIGGPHVAMDMIWPLAIIVRALTSTDDAEIITCIKTLISTHAGTGFMHESFHKDDPTKFTRSWFAWANTLFGELILKIYHSKPELLNQL